MEYSQEDKQNQSSKANALAHESEEGKVESQSEESLDSLTPPPFELLASNENSASSEEVVQRTPKIGFEMEDGDWRAWKKVDKENRFRKRKYVNQHDKNGIIPAGKKEVLHHGTGFNAEGDGITEQGEKRADMEFVTDPFPLTAEGHTALAFALSEIKGIYGRISPHAGQNHAHGDFVGRDIHGFDVHDVLLSQGGSDAKLNLQATSGLALKDIPLMYNSLTADTNSDDLDSEYKDAFIEIQRGNTGEQNPQEVGDLTYIKDAPHRAFLMSMAYLAEHLPEEADARMGDDTDDLYGFLTAVISFLRTLKYRNLNFGLKTFVPMMHRNDFVTMFGLLPDEQKIVLRANRQTFIDAIIYGVIGALDGEMDDFVPDDHQDEQVMEEFTLGSDDQRRMVQLFGSDAGLPNIQVVGNSLKRIDYSATPSQSIKDWITAWMSGADPKDLFTEEQAKHIADREADSANNFNADMLGLAKALPTEVSTIIDWEHSTMDGNNAKLYFNYDMLSEQQRRIIHFQFRGLGSLGEATDADDPELTLFENRSLQPYDSELMDDLSDVTNVSINHAEDSILSYFEGMMRILNPNQDR